VLLLDNYKENIAQNGFAIIPDVFSKDEVKQVVNTIEKAESSNATFRRNIDLFAIRQFLKEVPQAIPLIFSNRLCAVIKELFGNGYFVVKSIYFDKPGFSNWFVAYHQDLTISVDQKTDQKGFGPWSVKQNQYAVQPPLNILEENFTVRIHLDNADENNGALRVIPGSHLKGIYRSETIDWSMEREVCCKVPAGGIMIMRPLLMHASSKSTSAAQRRVIHIEFSNKQLPFPLNWSELITNTGLME